MIPMLRRLKILDYFFFAVIICGALWAGFFLYRGKNAAHRLIIEAPGGKWIYPLNDTRIVSIPGTLGNTLIKTHFEYKGKVTEEWHYYPCENGMGR